MTYTVSGGAGAASISSGLLPSGVTGSLSGGIYTLSGTPSPVGVYNFVVSLTTGVDTCTENVTIDVRALANAGTDGVTTVCDNGAVVNLFSLITGEQSGGVWTRTGGTGGTFNAGAGTFTPSAGAVNSTFLYTVAGVSPCPSDTSTVTVNINAQPTAGNDGGVVICGSSSTVIDLFSLITGEQGGGTWTRTGGTGGTFNAGAGTFNPTGAATSTFQYSVPGVAPCTGDQSVATVTISAQLDAGLDGSVTVCATGAPVDLFSVITGEQPGGVWTRTGGTGGTFNAGAGTFLPAGATASTFQYALTGTAPCVDDSSTATISINAQPDAGTDGGTVVCESSAATVDLFSLITGEQGGGTWTRTGGTGGVFNAAAGTFTPAAGASDSEFTYALTGLAPCVNDSSVATVGISVQPDAGTDGNTTVCDSSTAAINLFSVITGEQGGGIWTRMTGTGGTFNAAAGTFIPGGATTSTFEYTLIAIAPCSDQSSIATITINAQPAAGTDGNVSVCDSSTAAIDLFGLITGEQPGGTWTRNSGTGGAFDAVAGTFTPAPGATGSLFTYTLAGSAPCLNDSSQVTVGISAQPDAGTDGSVSVCDSSTSAINLFSLIGGEQPGGIWARASGSGGTFNAAAGTFTPAPGATDTGFTYTLTGTSPCANDVSTATVNISAQPDAGTDGSVSVCDDSPGAINLFGLITGEQPGGTWIRASGTGGAFNAAAGTFTPAAGATTSDFTYTITAAPECVDDSSTATISITARPDAGADGTTTVCESSAAAVDLFSLITGEQPGGTWTRAFGSGGTFNAAAGTFTPATGAVPSVFTYTVAGAGPCTDDTSSAIVGVSVQPEAGTGGSATVCDSSTSPISLAGLLTGGQSGGTWIRTGGTGGLFNASAGTFTPAPGATTSTFFYTITAAAPCVSDSATVTVNITAQPDAGDDAAVSICQSNTAVITLWSVITGEQPGGTWTRTSGTGGVFDPVAGTFTPGAGTTGSTFDYTIAGAAPCVDDSSTATVNISLQPDAGSDGVATVCETSTLAISLPGLITGEQPGGTWTRTSGTGGVFNAGAGTFTPGVGATTSTFAYTLIAASPCVNDASSVTVNIIAQPNAGLDAFVTVCETGTQAIVLANVITGEQPGGIWTRTSGSGGVFNASAGTFTPAPGASPSNTFAYTIQGAAPCVDDTSTATVNISAQPNAGTDGSTGVCETSATAVNLFNLITGEQPSGVWTRTSGTGGVFNAGAGTFTPAIGATTSTFSYTLAAASPCVNDVSIATVNISAQPQAGTGTGTTVCSLSTTVINLGDLVSGEQPGGTWTRSSGSGGAFSASAGTFTPALGATTSTFIYTLTATAPCVNATSTVTVTITPAIVPAFTQVAPICYGDALAALPGVSNNGITGTWSPPLADNTAGGTYIFTPTPGQCATSAQMAIIVNALPVVSLPQDGFICLDNAGNPSTTFLLSTGLSAGVYGFAWTGPGVPAGTATSGYLADEPGSYSVVVTNLATGCVSSATATVVTSYPPQIVQAVVSEYFSEQQVVSVSVSPAGNYEYQLDDGAFQDSNQFINVPSGDHTVHVRDRIGCGSAQDDFRIIDYPKFFTPNGDGYNDTWNIADLRDQVNSKIYLFDRYGKLMKEMSPSGTGWDGTFNGKPLPSTDYWFKVFFEENGLQREFKAHFSLKR